MNKINPYGIAPEEARHVGARTSADPVLELLHAAQALHDECAEYGRINNLGGYDNHNMRRIRAAIEATWRAGK